jgi:hypothetical protein
MCNYHDQSKRNRCRWINSKLQLQNERGTIVALDFIQTAVSAEELHVFNGKKLNESLADRYEVSNNTGRRASNHGNNQQNSTV